MMDDLVPTVAPLSKAQIEKDALEIINAYYPHLMEVPGPFPVLDFFDFVLVQDYEFETGVAELPAGIEGITFPDGRILVSQATYEDAARHGGRGRFTIAHECYHGIRHAVQLRKKLVHFGAVTLFRKHTVKPYLDPEWQAHYFASALLMPREMVLRLAEDHPPFLLARAMMSTFGVSFKAAQVRIDRLKLN